MGILKNIKPYHYVAILSLVIVASVGAYALNGSRAMSGSNGIYDISVSGLNISEAENAPGFKRATVNIKVANISKEILQVSPGMQMTLATNSGKLYSMTAKYLTQNEDIGGPIAIGANASMLVDYEIPTDESPKTLIFQKDLATSPTEVKL